MKRSRFSEEQIIGILKEHQAGLEADIELLAQLPAPTSQPRAAIGAPRPRPAPPQAG